METTPENIVSLKENEIFVFGSNRSGRHGKGVALVAVKKFGAKCGEGYGLVGQSYAIPTKDKKLKVLSIFEIDVQVQKFLRFAVEHPELKFYVTKIGCGLAGYSFKEIAPLFEGYSENVILPIEFIKILEKNERT